MELAALSVLAGLPAVWHLLLAGLVLAAAVVLGLLLAWAGKQTPRLADQPTPDRTEWPSVTLIVAARNEERHLPAALQSLLALDYPALSITVVNDRSTDGTGAILDRFAACASPLRVLHVTELPPGWLGKNHALQLAAAAATSQWLLFTDADVVLSPDALRRAIAYVLAERLDHLAVLPQPRVPGRWLQMLVVGFAVYFLLLVRAWAIRRRGHPAHVGVGAFNLVRAEAYRAVGGHEPIRLRPDDDLKLGKLLKRAGFSQGLAGGVGQVAVPWYDSVGAMIQGLEKNAFAAVEYRPLAVLAATLGVTVMHLWPFVALGLVRGPAGWLYLLASGVLWGSAAAAARRMGLSPWLGLGFPLAAAVLLGIQWRSMLRNYYHGGIRWRDTFYPLAALRANRV